MGKPRYTSTGKQVMRDGKHLADAATEQAATMIVTMLTSAQLFSGAVAVLEQIAAIRPSNWEDDPVQQRAYANVDAVLDLRDPDLTPVIATANVRREARCPGCDIPMAKRINLPEQWVDGDDVPDGLTIHHDTGTGRLFAFRGDQHAHDRVRL